MATVTFGLFGVGDMGAAVAARLFGHGARVVAPLRDRSPRTRRLAAQAGVQDCGDMPALLAEADLLLSIVPPAEAGNVARQVAAAAAGEAARPVFVDCNAVSPGTMLEIESGLARAGLKCVDAGIIGPPPRREGTTRFYVSGAVDAVAPLERYGLEVARLAGPVGAASGFKMCYAASTKGFLALCTELLAAAHGLNILEPLRREFEQSQPHLWPMLERLLPAVPSKCGRWIGEMEEIAACFEQQGLTPQIMNGVAALYRTMQAIPAAGLTPEQPDRFPDIEELARQMRATGT